jgi:predicted transposase YbfD/YdcC
LAKLAGQNQVSELADWAKLRKQELCQFFGLKRVQMPHLTTWSRLLGEKIDLIQLEAVLAEFFQARLGSHIPPRGSRVIGIDGKALRGSIPHGHTQGKYLMAAFLPKQGIVIGQVEVANGEVKKNETHAAPKLLNQIKQCLPGAVVVGDAMQCQRKLSMQISSGGGDWLWFVKGNQAEVLDNLQILFANEPLAKGHSPHPVDFETAHTLTKGHGRLEERTITVSSMLDEEYLKWPSVAQVFKVERLTRVQGVTKREVRYGITSLPRSLASPQRLLALTRLEWGIENQLHYRRDYTLREDWSQLRRGASQQVNACLNNVVIGLMGLAGVNNLAAKRRELAYDPSLALDWLFHSPLSSI